MLFNFKVKSYIKIDEPCKQQLALAPRALWLLLPNERVRVPILILVPVCSGSTICRIARTCTWRAHTHTHSDRYCRNLCIVPICRCMRFAREPKQTKRKNGNKFRFSGKCNRICARARIFIVRDSLFLLLHLLLLVFGFGEISGNTDGSV